MSSRFSSLRPGPKLARRLAQVELGSLPDEAMLDYLHAEVRQLACQQARVWAAMGEVERRVAGAYAHDADWSPERVFECAAHEIVSELRVSTPYAKRELQRADDLDALPSVAAALRAGQIDRNRVVVLLDTCTGMSPEHRDQLLDAVLPTAGSIPPGKLRAEAQHLAIALDPEWAERRYREAVRQRRVVRYINDDGSVTIAAEDQDAAEALAAYARLTGLARAAKKAGAHARLDALRSDISMGLQGHRFTGMHENDIIDYLVAKYPKPVPDEPAEDIVTDEPAAPTEPEPTAAEPTEPEPTDAEPVDDEPVEAGPTDAVRPSDHPSTDEPPAGEESVEAEYYEAELLAQDLLDQGFVDDQQCTAKQRDELIDIALAIRRSYSRRPPTDQDPDPPLF